MKKYLGKAIVAAVVGSGFWFGQTVMADSYAIQEGDSFYSIAQQYGVDVYELAAHNGLGIYDLIVPGQILTIPGVVTNTPAPLASEEPAPAATSTSYTIQEGDSFSSIASLYNMDFYQLAENNGLSIDAYLMPGQTLQVLSTSAAPAATPASSYYLEGHDYEPGVNYPIGQCTWAVQKLTTWAGDWWGNAADWGRNAAREGFVVGETPVVGAIAVWDDGALGHVAYVTEVGSDTNILVLEANIKGKQWIDNHRGWINPQDGVLGHVSYIYPR